MNKAGRAITRYDLYEWCVQSPEMQARFLRALHGGRPRVMVEDFCGPASIARAWSLLGSGYAAHGVDRDAEPLTHALLRASEQRIPEGRFSVARADVLRTLCPKEGADVIAAFNFAVCELHDRRRLLSYLRRVRNRLKPKGIFACDVYGGVDSYSPGTSVRKIRTPVGRVEYTWQQRRADPLSGRVENAMHFRIGAARPLRNAFVYDWRLWSVPELLDALTETGFRSVQVHLSYGEAIDGSGNPVPTAAEPWSEAGDRYVAYVVGRR